MSTALHLAGPADIGRLMPLVEAFHAHAGIELTGEARRDALMPLLTGSPHGAIWLIGPRSAPVGYLAVGFSWSIEMGGLDAMVDEFFIRERIRGRGMGGDALSSLARALAAQGVCALHLEVARTASRQQGFYRRLGFAARESYHLMTRML